MAKKKVRELTIEESEGSFKLFRRTKQKSKYDFEGLAMIRKVLSKEKARLLNVIKNEKPESIYALAKILSRDFKSVSDDVKLLERLGFIELISEKSKKRKRLRPTIVIDTLTIHFKL